MVVGAASARRHSVGEGDAWHHPRSALSEAWIRVGTEPMGVAAALFAIATAVIVSTWGWFGTAVEMPQSPLAPGEKLHCVSYAPFRRADSIRAGRPDRSPADRRG